MDEPLGALDKKLRAHMQVEIKEIQRRLGMTVALRHARPGRGDEHVRPPRDHEQWPHRPGRARRPTVYEHPHACSWRDFLGEANLIEGAVDGSAGEIDVRSARPAGWNSRRRADARRAPRAAPRQASVFRPEKLCAIRATRLGAALGPIANHVQGRVVQAIFRRQHPALCASSLGADGARDRRGAERARPRGRSRPAPRSRSGLVARPIPACSLLA